MRPRRSVWSMPHNPGTFFSHRLCTFRLHANPHINIVRNFTEWLTNQDTKHISRKRHFKSLLSDKIPCIVVSQQILFAADIWTTCTEVDSECRNLELHSCILRYTDVSYNIQGPATVLPHKRTPDTLVFCYIRVCHSFMKFGVDPKQEASYLCTWALDEWGRTAESHNGRRTSDCHSCVL